MSSEERGRTKIEISNDIAYEVRLHERHVRLYRRIRAGLAFIALCGGASAFANLFNDAAWLRGLGGAVVAACAFLDVVFDFATKAAAHESMRRQYLQLQSREADLSVSALDRELARLGVDDPGAIESLRQPALNDVLRSRGYYDHVMDLTLRERLLGLLA